MIYDVDVALKEGTSPIRDTGADFIYEIVNQELKKNLREVKNKADRWLKVQVGNARK